MNVAAELVLIAKCVVAEGRDRAVVELRGYLFPTVKDFDEAEEIFHFLKGISKSRIEPKGKPHHVVRKAIEWKTGKEVPLLGRTALNKWVDKYLL